MFLRKMKIVKKKGYGIWTIMWTSLPERCHNKKIFIENTIINYFNYYFRIKEKMKNKL